jgi:hypothetical protein
MAMRTLQVTASGGVSSNRVEHIVAAAVRLPDGRVFGDCTHFGAVFVAFRARAFPPLDPKATKAWNALKKLVDDMELDKLYRLEDGFTTNTGRFIDRYEAFRVAESARQLKVAAVLDSDRCLTSDMLTRFH